MDAKSKLQHKVLALKRGYTASDINYASTRSKNDKWSATVHISHLKFPITDLFYNKRSAETAAAQNILDSWRGVSKKLKRRQKKNPKYSFREEKKGNSKRITHFGSDLEDDDDESEWLNLSEEGSSGLSREDYIELGKLTEKIFLIIQKTKKI